MATIITREVGATAKGTTLTNAEIDNNFINLNNELSAKANTASPTLTGTVTVDKLSVLSPGGDEGGEINLALAQTNNLLNGSVAIDINQNQLRIFETGGTNRGVFINLASAGASVGTNLLANAPIAAADVPNLDASKITTGTIAAARLPSYVDDVLEAANLAAFPATGETGKIYVALDTNKTYRWSGSAYVYITSGAVDSVAGKTGVVTLVKGDVGLGSVDNTADSAKNVLSATKLTTARTIGGVSFDGTVNINLPGVNAAGNQNTTGNAGTATTLQTARNINGTSFNGSADITTANWGTARTLTIGNTGKSVNGSANVSWSVAEIGAGTGHVYGYTATYSVPAAMAESWFKISDAYNSVVYFSISSSYDNTMHEDHVVATVFGYNMKHHLSSTTSDYNVGRLLEIKTNNNGSAGTTEIWARFGAATGAGQITIKSSHVIPTLVPATPTFGGTGIVSLLFDTTTRTTSSLLITRGIRIDGNVTLHAGNYNSYSPTLTGTGASGSWGISITGSSASTTGNAATATALQTARTINGVSFNGSANITVADATKLPLAGGTLTGELTIATGAATGLRINTSTGTQSLWVRAGYDSDGTATPVVSATNIQFQSSGSSGGTFSFVSGNTKSLTIGSVVNSLVALQQTGNQVLHAGNVSTYALPIGGGTLTGAYLDFSNSSPSLRITSGPGTFFIGDDDIVNLGSGAVVATPSSRIASGVAILSTHAYATSQGDNKTHFGYYNGTSYVNYIRGAGTYFDSSTLQIAGNQALHAGNYNSYSPTLTGTGASGTWGISITGSSASTTGNAATATALQTARTINGVSFNGTANITVADSTKLPLAGGTLTGGLQVGYGGGDLTIRATAANDLGDLVWADYAGTEKHRLWDGTSGLLYRNNGGTGYLLVHAGNYNSYSPTLTGTGASGTWGIAITGTAANASQLGGISSNRAILKRRARIHSTDSTSLNSSITAPEMGFTYGGSGEPAGPFVALGGLGGDIDYSMQLVGAYSGGGNQFVIRTRNDDAASWNAWRTIITDGNYTSYSPSLTGSGASGTWGISITGNAATATALQTARTITIGATGRSFNGSANVSWTLAEIGAQAALGFTPANVTQLTAGYTQSNFDTIKAPGLYQYDGTMTATPNGRANYRSIEIGSNGRYSQIALPWDQDGMWFRRQMDTTWGTWREVLHSGNYNNYSPTLTGTGASGSWGISVTGSAATLTTARTLTIGSTGKTFNGSANVAWSLAEIGALGASAKAADSELLDGYNSTAFSGPVSAIKQFFWDNLSASGTQARTFEIARLAVDYNDWNGGIGPFEVELYEGYYSRGLKKKYVIHWGYTNTYGIQLVEYSGSGDNNFQVRVGAPVLVSGDNYYLPVYVDVRYYATVDVRVTTNRDITGSNPPGVGSAYINASPSPTNISDFTPDSTVNFSSVSTVQVAGNQLLHAGNYNSYSPTLTGSGASGTWGISITGSSASTTGNAASATRLINLRTINGVGFDGTANITVADSTKLPLSGGTLTGALNLAALENTLVAQHDGNTAVWRGRILSKNATSDRAAFLGTYAGIAGVFAHNNALNAWADLYVNTSDGTNGGTVRTTTSVLMGGNQALHAGNYNSYSPTLTGGGASGSWGISVTGSSASTTGNAATATALQTARTIGGVSFNGTANINLPGVNAAGNQNTSGTATNATNTTITNDTTTTTAQFVTFVGASSGNTGQKTHSTGLTFIPSTGALTASGNITAYSDESLKKDWAPVATDFVVQLANIKHGTYTRIDSGERQAGASAQDWQKLLPETVLQGSDGKLSLAYGNAALVSAIQLAQDNLELRARIDRLESLIELILNKE